MKQTIHILAVFGLFLFSGAAVVFVGCRKGPGPGGRASITGKVYLRVLNNVNNSYYKIDTSYYPGAENVYISYGDEPGVGRLVKTAEDGSYLFDFLRPGKYKVYAISRDTTNKLNSAKRIVSMKEVEISGRTEQIILDDIVILK